jgi:hypothetical protein
LLLTLRPPCLLTLPPAAAITKVEQVEMLKVLAPSPPVPTMSTRWDLSCTCTLLENSRITSAAAEISPMVSFFTRRPVMMAAVITGELAAHDHAHQVQHFVVEDFAVLDGALQRFLGVMALMVAMVRIPLRWLVLPGMREAPGFRLFLLGNRSGLHTAAVQ